VGPDPPSREFTRNASIPIVYLEDGTRTPQKGGFARNASKTMANVWVWPEMSRRIPLLMGGDE